MGNEAMEKAERILDLHIQCDINEVLHEIIIIIPDEILPAVIDKLGSEGTVNSEEVNTKFLLI